MGVEIERKFLVKNNGWKAAAEEGIPYEQGYLSRDRNCTVRARLAGNTGFLTIKGPADPQDPLAHPEYEYEIPAEDARRLIDTLCIHGRVQKTRHRVPHGKHVWEVDVFHGENEGLVMAEVELAASSEAVALPDWAGEEVSQDGRYTNASLAQKPYKNWAA
jgi:adenylate cyclase